jgi:penicillin G amidase
MGSFTSLVTLVALVACGDNTGGVRGPFDELPLDGRFDVGLDAPVHVARDRFGVAHIHARSVGDAAFVQGYVMAHDRLPQMDILRRFGSGTLAELFGGLEPGVIDVDLEMRVHRMKPLAEATWEVLQASSAPDDVEIVRLLTRFADGVNTYAADAAAGKWRLDPNLLVSFDPARFRPWTPVDSLVLGRFQAFALSWTAPVEIDLTEMYQKLRARFDQAAATDPAAFARRGISRDLLTLEPVGLVPTIDGFPNTSGSSRAVAPTTARRPEVAQATLDKARAFFARHIFTGPFGAPGPHALMAPYAGSNNWAVGPSRANGRALLAGDQHLQLPNPSVFYPTHLIIGNGDDVRDPGEIDLLGVTFAGIPGVILGSNGDLAWSATVSFHDVNDIYLETISPCPDRAGDCVAYQGGQVPIEQHTEEIQIGALGTIFETRTATYEIVPHHGPIIPEVVNQQIVPRTASEALSVRYTGYEPTFELRTVWALARAETVEQGMRAFEHFSYGSQNWTMIDNTGAIAWTTQAHVPLRARAAHAWHRDTAPDAPAPFFVLPGDGSTEWEGRLDARYIPHAVNPAQGYIATANSDPVGATFDGDPLDQALPDGTPLFLSAIYPAGVRTERIANLIEAGGDGLTLVDMARIQHDSSSTVGAKLAPLVVAELAKLDAPETAPADFQAYLAGLSTADRQRLTLGRALLGGWSFATPTALDAPDPDSAATAVFNAWMHFFLNLSIADEYAAAGFDMWRIDDNLHVRTAWAMLSRPGSFVQSASTGQPIVCDRFDVPGPDDSCTTVVAQALVAAMTHLASSEGFGTADTAQWRWGRMHRLTLKPLFPNSNLELPTRDEPHAGGFPKPGDNFVINRADQGWGDLDFSQNADGAAQRWLAQSEPGRPISVKWQLPTGVIYDSTSPHYRDLLDEYYLPEVHFDAPYLVPEIVSNGETRWEFR